MGRLMGWLVGRWKGEEEGTSKSLELNSESGGRAFGPPTPILQLGRRSCLDCNELSFGFSFFADSFLLFFPSSSPLHRSSTQRTTLRYRSAQRSGTRSTTTQLRRRTGTRSQSFTLFVNSLDLDLLGMNASLVRGMEEIVLVSSFAARFWFDFLGGLARGGGRRI